MPSEGNFLSLDKTVNGLTAIACETWNDWVFVNFDESPRQNLREYLGGLTDYADAYPMREFDVWAHV